MSNQAVDITIVGGGLAGMTLALALQDSGYSILLVDNKPNTELAPNPDGRTLALSPASQRILDYLSVWSKLGQNITAIDSIDVSEQHRFGRTRLNAEQDGPLGYVVPIDVLFNALQQQLTKTQLLMPATVKSFDKVSKELTIETEQGLQRYSTQLLVAADGTDSPLRAFSSLKAEKKNYAHHALVANLSLARPHQQAAHERFTPVGPLAMLPMTGQKVTMVWTLPLDKAQPIKDLSDADWLACVQKAFGYKLGRFTAVGQRHLYPLRQVIMPTKIDWPMVFIGNAAQTMHPVAGQGFNLGLRDVATLAECIQKEGLNDKMLQTYQAMRLYDQKSITLFTDKLVQLFDVTLPGFSHLRAMGLVAMDNIRPVKNILLKHTRGLAGHVPEMAYLK